MSVPRSVPAALLGLVYSHSGLGVSTGLLTYWAWGQYWSTHILGLGSVLVYFLE